MQINTRETLSMALDSVWAHKLRSGLTILGIVIGITTVVTVASLLTGVNQQMVDFFKQFGPNSIYISRLGGDPSSDNAPPKMRRRKQFRADYADLLRDAVLSIDDIAVSLYITGSGGHIISAKVPGFETDNVHLVGETPNLNNISPRDIGQGRFFTPEEARRSMRIAVIGAHLADALFPAHDAINKTFQVDGIEYTVIGVFAPAKGGFFGENSMDYEAVVPYQTAHNRYPGSRRFYLTADARPGMRDDAVAEIRDAMRKIRHVPKGKEDDFELSTPDSIISNFTKITGMIVLISIAISAVGLLVGGIGVMNIMLVSVTERTREIGVRKAVGARKRDIIAQFLSEAVALTGVGGIIGIVFSISVTLLVSAIFPSLPSIVPAWAVITGFSVSVGVGVFFGVWPAVLASNLDPVEALRYE
jgi:putative ABC transport system permease protein